MRRMGREMARQTPLCPSLRLMGDRAEGITQGIERAVICQGCDYHAAVVFEVGLLSRNSTCWAALMKIAAHAHIRDSKVATSFKIVPDGAACVALCVNVLNSLAVVPSLLQRPALPPAPCSRHNGTIMDFYRRVSCAND